jgi:hypothetical protein
MQDMYLFCNHCGKKINSPCERHWNTVAQVVGYLYANWAASSINTRSTYEYSIIIKDSFISWKSKKQKVLATSHPNEKNQALALAICELNCLKKLQSYRGLANVKTKLPYTLPRI